MYKKPIKAYIAGPLGSKKDRDSVQKISDLCKGMGLKTFLPHRDVGLWSNFKDTKKIAKGDLKGFKDCKLLVANLNGFTVGTGTVWEMGYAHAKRIPVIAIKTDRKVEDSIDELSAIVIGTTKIVDSLENLEKEIKKLLKDL